MPQPSPCPFNVFFLGPGEHPVAAPLGIWGWAVESESTSPPTPTGQGGLWGLKAAAGV